MYLNSQKKIFSYTIYKKKNYISYEINLLGYDR